VGPGSCVGAAILLLNDCLSVSDVLLDVVAIRC